MSRCPKCGEVLVKMGLVTLGLFVWDEDRMLACTCLRDVGEELRARRFCLVRRKLEEVT